MTTFVKSPGELSVAGAVPGALDPQVKTTTNTMPLSEMKPGLPNPGIKPGLGGTIPLGGISSFTPTDTLRNKQINPGVASPVPVGQDTQQIRQLAVGDLQSLAGPDRGAIAQDVFSQIRESSQPQFEQDLRRVGQDAARFGRLGAGMTTSRLGDVMSNREKDLALAARGLSSEAASRSLDDRLGVADARLRGTSQFTGEDLARRSAGFSEGLTQRNELRGERSYQDDLGRLATDDRVRQLLLEDQLLNSSFNRDTTRLGQLGNTGYGGLPTSELRSGADYYGGQAGQNMDAIAQAMRLWGQQGGGGSA